MKVLVVGGGGREHALAWKCARSPRVDEVLVAPGNAGTAREPKVRNVAVDAGDVEAVVALARAEGVDLVVVGPEAPLVAGIADALAAAGVRCFGPRRAKADGLAAGKGVTVARSVEEAQAAARAMLAEGAFGEAGRRVVVEEFLEGEEASFIVMVGADGAVLPLATSQDHKAVGEGDTGPNTGGMGAYSPAPVVTPEVHRRIMEAVILPTVRGLESEGRPYLGFLYAGLMIGPDGAPRVLEFNVRFGDPEAGSPRRPGRGARRRRLSRRLPQGRRHRGAPRSRAGGRQGLPRRHPPARGRAGGDRGRARAVRDRPGRDGGRRPAPRLRGRRPYPLARRLLPA